MLDADHRDALAWDACPSPAASFSNAEWRLVDDGLEHGATGYFIAGATLAARRGDGLWEWPLHLAEKSWCSPRLFREAFLAALRHFGLERDDELTRSFAIGFGTRASSSVGKGGFVPLGELVRPKPNDRKRPGPAEPRMSPRPRRAHREVATAQSGG